MIKMEKTKVYSIHNNHLLNTLTIKRKYQSRTIEDIKFINTNLIVFVLIKSVVSNVDLH